MYKLILATRLVTTSSKCVKSGLERVVTMTPGRFNELEAERPKRELDSHSLVLSSAKISGKTHGAD